jgi:hypothetical protein
MYMDSMSVYVCSVCIPNVDLRGFRCVKKKIGGAVMVEGVAGKEQDKGCGA